MKEYNYDCIKAYNYIIECNSLELDVCLKDSLFSYEMHENKIVLHFLSNDSYEFKLQKSTHKKAIEIVKFYLYLEAKKEDITEFHKLFES